MEGASEGLRQRSEEAGISIYHFSYQWLELLSEIWFPGKAEAGIVSGTENAEMIGHIERTFMKKTSPREKWHGLLPPSLLPSLPLGFPSGSTVKNRPVMKKTQKLWVQALDHEDPVEEEMATHSSIFA